MQAAGTSDVPKGPSIWRIWVWRQGSGRDRCRPAGCAWPGAHASYSYLGAISSIACHYPARHVPLFVDATAYLPEHMPTGKTDACATQDDASVFMS